MLALSMTMCISGYAEGITSEVTTIDKVEYLLSLGIPGDLISKSPETEIDDMYASFFEKSVEYLGTETTTMSLEDDLGSIEVYDNIQSADMSFSTSYFSVKNDKYATKNDPIDYLEIRVSYEWSKGHPFVRWTDGITVNWDSNVFTYKSGSFTASDIKWLMGAEVKRVDYTRPAELTQGGIGFYTDLNTLFAGSVQTGFSCGGRASIKLLPKHSPMYIGNIGVFSKNTTINANYLHNKNPLGLSVGFNIEGVQVIAAVGGISDGAANSVSVSYK